MKRKSTRLRIQRLRTIVVSLVLLSLTLSHASCFLDENLDQYYGRKPANDQKNPGHTESKCFLRMFEEIGNLK